MKRLRKQNIHAAKLAKQRWSKVPQNQRAKHVPRSGGRPRIYPKCPTYGSHRFSPRTERCPCGYTRILPNSYQRTNISSPWPAFGSASSENIMIAIAPLNAPRNEWVTIAFAPGLGEIRSNVEPSPGPTTKL